jgi:hypothetical protein
VKNGTSSWNVKKEVIDKLTFLIFFAVARCVPDLNESEMTKQRKEGIMMAKIKEKKGKTSKKCRGCGLDCSIVRGVALTGVPDSQKKEKAIAMFGSEKSKYTPETCIKR